MFFRSRDCLWFMVYCLLGSFIFITGCGRTGIHKRSELAMGTVVEISVADEDKSAEEVERAIGKAFEEIKRIEKLLSSYDENSEVSRLNRLGEREAVVVSDETFELIKRSIEFSKLSGGAFDITVAPILELWGFSVGSSVPKLVRPQDEEIQAKLSLVGSDKIIVDDKHRVVGFTRPGMKIDLGGIAKGYAVDRAVEVLRSEGISRAMINAGGDIYCLGAKRVNNPWVIAIKHPRNPNQILTTLKIRDQAIATSGDYEKYFMVEERRYCHIIDPRSGYPVQNDVMSVTILASSCLEADALSTAVFVMGRDKGLDLINQFDGTEAIIKTLDD